MAQTTNAKMFVNAKVELSTDDSAWTNISGHGAAVAVDDGAVIVAEEHTFDGDTPIIQGGKRAGLDVTVRFLYTETSEEPFEVARAIYETDGKACYVRYSPLGGDTGDFRFSSAQGVMQEFMYPQGEAESSELIPSEITVRVPYLTKSEIS
jgi:hypothetical protein